MKLSLAAGALLASSVIAAPTNVFSRQSSTVPLDIIVLQFALTLEHLENVFYKEAFANFTAQDFIDAGYSSTYYNNLNFIAHDEEVHVEALTAAITAAGYAPVAACSYKFPYTDVSSFITLSSVLEGVGTSAYLAGAPLLTSKSILTVAGSILVTEALHTSYQRAAKGEVPMANPFGTPLDPTSVFTLAAMFITSCPASNFALPFVPFATLTYDATSSCTCEEPDCAPSAAIKKRGADADQAGKRWESTKTWSGWPEPTETSSPSAPSYCAPPMAGASIMLTAASDIPAGSFVTFISGLNVVSVMGDISMVDITVMIPSVAMGQTYVFITNCDLTGMTFSDTAVLFGPAIVEVAPPPPTLDYSVLKA